MARGMTQEDVVLPAAAAPGSVGPRQRWFAWAVIAALAGGGVLATPLADTMLVVIPDFFGMFQAVLFVINLMLTALLFIKGRIQERGDTIRLGAAYCFVTLIIIPQLATSAGGFMPAPLIGTAQTPLWVWWFWHVGFGLAIIRYAWFAARPVPPPASVPRSVLAVAVFTLAAGYVASFGTDVLPAIQVDGHYLYTGTALMFWVPPIIMSVVSLYAVARLRLTSPERLWLFVGLVATGLEVWLNLHDSPRFTLGWYFAEVCSLVTPVAVLISQLHDITSIYRAAEAAEDSLRTTASRDSLTGLFSRHHLDEMLTDEFYRAMRQKLPLAFVLLDIDFFKNFNDLYGPTEGDQCIRRVGLAVTAALFRPHDYAARYAGEEIAVLLPGTELTGALEMAERICAAVGALRIEHSNSSYGVVTVSAGVASFAPPRRDQEPADLVRAACNALRQAKKDGRNCFRAENPDAVPRPLYPVAGT